MYGHIHKLAQAEKEGIESAGGRCFPPKGDNLVHDR